MKQYIKREFLTPEEKKINRESKVTYCPFR